MVGYELNTTDVLRHGSEMFLFVLRIIPLAMIFATYRVYKSTLPPRLFLLPTKLSDKIHQDAVLLYILELGLQSL